MSDTRTAIVERVRRALSYTDRMPVVVPRPIPQRPIRQGLLDLFVERVEDYDAAVHRCPPDRVAEALAAVLGGQRTVVPRGFPWGVPRPVADRGLSPADLGRMPAVVTTATLGIATTGSLVLTHGNGQGAPAVSKGPDLHVCVILADQVVLGVPDAIAALDPHRPQTWVSGPSAISGIELDRLAGGVHGPRTLHVVLVEGGR